MISPRPSAPALMSASSCAAAFAPNPGPTSRNVMLVNIANRSLCRLARMAASCCSKPLAGRAAGVDHHLHVDRVHGRARPRRSRPPRSAAADVRGCRRPETSPAAPDAAARRAWSAACTRGCWAAGLRAAGLPPDGAGSGRAAAVRRPTATARSKRREDGPEAYTHGVKNIAASRKPNSVLCLRVAAFAALRR